MTCAKARNLKNPAIEMKTIILRPVLGAGDTGIEEINTTMPDMPESQSTPSFLGDEKRQGAAANGGQSGADFRTLKVTLSADEMWAVGWAARHTPYTLPDGRRGKSSPLAKWIHDGVIDLIRAKVKSEIERGHAIPQEVAAVLDRNRPR